MLWPACVSWQSRDKNPLLKFRPLSFLEEESREVTASFCQQWEPGAKFLEATGRPSPHSFLPWWAGHSPTMPCPALPCPGLWTAWTGEWLVSFVFSASVWRKRASATDRVWAETRVMRGSQSRGTLGEGSGRGTWGAKALSWEPLVFEGQSQSKGLGQGWEVVVRRGHRPTGPCRLAWVCGQAVAEIFLIIQAGQSGTWGQVLMASEPGGLGSYIGCCDSVTVDAGVGRFSSPGRWLWPTPTSVTLPWGQHWPLAWDADPWSALAFIQGSSFRPTCSYSSHSVSEKEQRCFLVKACGIFQGVFCFVLFRFLFTAAPMAHGNSQARGQIWATAAGRHHSHSNTGSLTHWAKPDIKTTSSWILVRFLTHWATVETPSRCFW